jgi:hypothetical protein
MNSLCDVDPPTVEDILVAYLRAHDYDGLAGDECGCALPDIAPCASWCGDCVAGWRIRVGPNDDRYVDAELIIVAELRPGDVRVPAGGGQ